MLDLRLMAIFLVGGAPMGHLLAPLNFKEMASLEAAISQLVPHAGFHVLGGTIAYILFRAFRRLQRRAQEKREDRVVNG